MKLTKKIKRWFDMYPPSSGTMEEWEEFNKQCSKKYPIRFWIDETFVPNVVWPVSRFFKNIRDQFRFRFFERLHIIDTKLKPDYYDADTRLLHSTFSLIVDFVEIEKAWMQAILVENYKKPWYPFKRFRSRELGLRYLFWEMSLKNEDTKEASQQALDAKIIKDLYIWWVHIRPNRIDPYSLLDSLPDQGLKLWNRTKPSDEKMKIYKQIDDLEKQYLDEDTKMLKTIIDIRGSLWT